MNIGDIIDASCLMLGNYDRAKTQSGSIDLGIIAANNARRYAEKRHDWSQSIVSGEIRIDPVTGGSASSMRVPTWTTPLSTSASGSLTTYGTIGQLVNATWLSNVEEITLTAGGVVVTPETVQVVAKSFDGDVTAVYFLSGLSGAIEATDELVNAVFANTQGATVNIKSFLNFWHADRQLPIKFMDAKLFGHRRQDQELENELMDYERYQTDEGSQHRSLRTVLIRGGQLWLDPMPTDTYDIKVDAYKWFSDYTSDSDTDFFTDKGQDYMLHAVAVELNRLAQRWVPRQEGSLAPPTKERDLALATLIQQDVMMTESGRRGDHYDDDY